MWQKLPVAFLTREFSQRGQFHETQLSIEPVHRARYRFSKPSGRALEAVREKAIELLHEADARGPGGRWLRETRDLGASRKPKLAQADGETASPADSGWLIHVGELHERR